MTPPPVHKLRRVLRAAEGAAVRSLKAWSTRREADLEEAWTHETRAFDESAWHDPFTLLRSKWGTIPAGSDRSRSTDLLSLSDDALAQEWEARRASAADGHMFGVRGWYYTLYRDILRDKRVVDVGSGMGFDAITFAQAGARVICADIVESNLEVIERVAALQGLQNIEFAYLENIDSYDELPMVDVVWCQGSMINAPVEVAKEEAERLLRKLPSGGRWIELAYPRERWVREGRMPATAWGAVTDGGAPWMEWYDLPKLLDRLAPATFEVVLAFNFHHDDFNWFDLVRT